MDLLQQDVKKKVAKKKSASCPPDKMKGYITRTKYKYKRYASQCVYQKTMKRCHYHYSRRNCQKTCFGRGKDSRWGKRPVRRHVRKFMKFKTKCAYWIYNQKRYGRSKKTSCSRGWIQRRCKFTCTGRGVDNDGTSRRCPKLKALPKSSSQCPKATKHGQEQVRGNCLKPGLKVGSLCDGDGECGTNRGGDINNCWWINRRGNTYRRSSQGADVYRVTAVWSGKPQKPKPYSTWVSVIVSRTRKTRCAYYKSRGMCRTRKRWMSQQCATTCNLCKTVCADQYPAKPFSRNKYYTKYFKTRCAYYKARSAWYVKWCKIRRSRYRRSRCRNYYA